MIKVLALEVHFVLGLSLLLFVEFLFNVHRLSKTIMQKLFNFVNFVLKNLRVDSIKNSVLDLPKKNFRGL